jgi:hypothetical protein
MRKVIMIALGILVGYLGASLSTTMSEPNYFNLDYKIDLKQDHYIIIDERDGSVDTVAFGELEEWFLDDNL